MSGTGPRLSGLGQFEAAEQTLPKAIGLRPQYWDNYNELGNFYVKRGRYEEAIPMFRRITELTPDNLWGYTNLGVAYYTLGQLDQAATMFRRTLEIQPDALAYSNLGVVYYFTGHYADSARMFEKATQLEHQNYSYWGNLAGAYRWAPGEEGRAKDAYTRAIALAEKSLEVNPRDTEVLGELDGYHANTGAFEKARQLIGKALAIAPKEPALLGEAAKVYAQAGDLQKAFEYLKSSLQAGYPRLEIGASPELAGLRKDPRYREIMNGAPKPR